MPSLTQLSFSCFGDWPVTLTFEYFTNSSLQIQKAKGPCPQTHDRLKTSFESSCRRDSMFRRWQWLNLSRQQEAESSKFAGAAQLKDCLPMLVTWWIWTARRENALLTCSLTRRVTWRTGVFDNHATDQPTRMLYTIQYRWRINKDAKLPTEK